MTSTLNKNLFLKIWQRFRDDEKGSISIEFALASMFFMTLMTSTAWLAQNEDASTQTGKVTATVSNLLTKSPLLDASVIDASLLAGRTMLGDETSENLEIYVSGIKISRYGQPTVLWSRGRCLKTLQLPRANAPYIYKDKLAKDLFNLDFSFQSGRPKFNEKFFVVAHARLAHKSLKTIAGHDEDHSYEYIHTFAPRKSVETACLDCNTRPALSCP